MKICPKCNIQFDNELIYCLHDGSMLVDKSTFASSEETIVLPPFKTIQNGKNHTQTSKILISLIGLVAILAVIFAGLFFWKQTAKKEEDAQSNTSPTTNDYELKKRELELKDKELELKKQELSEGQKNSQNLLSATSPIEPRIKDKPLPPVQSSITNGTKYSGSIGNSNAIFNLVWNKNKTVSGSYYFTSNPSQSYTLSGTNYRDGEIELQEYGNMNARIKMYKSVQGKVLCWNGNYYASNGNLTINFCRYR